MLDGPGGRCQSIILAPPAEGAGRCGTRPRARASLAHSQWLQPGGQVESSLLETGNKTLLTEFGTHCGSWTGRWRHPEATWHAVDDGDAVGGLENAQF